MRVAPSPRVHLFVCANRRQGSPLGPGCAERGDAVYDALKAEVSERGLVADVWVTKTHCLGVCPKQGATCARHPSAGGAVVTDVEPHDARALVDEAVVTMEAGPPPSWDVLERELSATEELHTKKVLDLARRLKPGLTGEDIQNPHDFPELDDPDWHYSDGILTGVKTASSALRALRRRGG